MQTGLRPVRRTRRGNPLVYAGIVLALLVVAALAAVVWSYWDYFRPPEALYSRARAATSERAASLYDRLAEKMPMIEEYARLWKAEATMPSLGAVEALQAVIAYRPHSPAAFEAHLRLARYYAEQGLSQAEGEYRAALALDDTLALRRELARYLEDQGNDEAAYQEYRTILSRQPDAFAGMRRLGDDPLSVAEDLNRALYHTDALETLRGVEGAQATLLRAEALSGLGRHGEAEAAYRAYLEANQGDTSAQMGLARTLGRLGQIEEALEQYEEIDTADSRLAQAELLEAEDPDRALELYLDLPYPVAWWSAASILDAQGRLTETLPIYGRVADADTYLADDAAYRRYVLAHRAGDEEAKAAASAQLEELGLNWLALRASGQEPALDSAPPPAEAGEDALGKAEALEQIGRPDLAYRELLFTARASPTPELDLAMAQALSERGYMLDAQAIAAAYTARKNYERVPPAFWRLSYPRPYREEVEAAASEFGVDPLLIWAVMRQESIYDPDARSWVGAQGLMQIMPATQGWIAETMGETIAPGKAYEPETNIRLGAWFLRFLLDYFEDDLELAVLAYNGGAGSVDIWLDDPKVSDRDDLIRWVSYGETREYLAKVVMNYRVYQAVYETDGS